jgi:hypothetical protein
LFFCLIKQKTGKKKWKIKKSQISWVASEK